MEITDEDQLRAYWECVEEEIKDEIDEVIAADGDLPLSERALQWCMEEF